MKVFLIEDDESIVQIYKKAFTLAEHEIAIAENGQKGLDAIMSMKKMPDIIILDLMMPKLNGFDFMGKFKKTSKDKDVPIIVLSNLNQESDVDEAMGLGAQLFLVKSKFLPKEIVKKAEELVAGDKISNIQQS